MSLILEALKKSEAERRRAKASDLLGADTGHKPDRRSWAGGLVSGMVVALVLVAAGWGWTRWHAPPDPVGQETTANRTSAERPLHERPDAAPSAPAGARETQPRAPASRAAPTPRDPDVAGVERESVPVAAGTRPPAGMPAGQSAPTPTAAPVVQQEPTPAPQPAPAPAAAPARPLLPQAVDPVALLSSLPAARRDALPPLRLSMHVFDPEPAARFVLIDGQRLAEGATITAGLKVAEIRSDGVVLEIDGERYLLIRP